MKNNKGYTIVELVVVMLIFLVVIMITAGAFDRIISSSSQLTKSSQSNIEGIIGLELMRADLESTGFGLPSSFRNPIKYDECQVAADYLVVGVDPALDFNDGKGTATDGNVPRAVLSKAATSGSDYLVVKSAAVGMTSASKKWSYVNYSSPKGIVRSYGGANLNANDRVITVRLGFGTEATSNSRELIATSAASDNYFYNLTNNLADANFSPGDATENYVVYGIYSNSDVSKKPSMPFNRADYFVYRPTGANTMSSRCATGTGNLYKAAINHVGGGYTQYPLLDCVLDMQVSYIRDISNDGTLIYTDTLAALSAQEIREQIKSVQVSILAQEGGFDRSFTYPQSTISVGFPGVGKTWDATAMTAAVGANWRNYRWKVYEIMVQPKNLNR